MASLSESAKGFRVFWLDEEKRRRSILLGKVSRRNAERFLTYLERLLECRAMGLVPDPETQRWLDSLGDTLARKLARHGLVEVKERLTLGGFLTEWKKAHAHYGAGTRDAWDRSINDLLTFFAKEKRIGEITPTDAQHYRDWLRDDRRLSDATINKRLGHVRTFFNFAVRLKMLSENPFRYVTHRVSETKRKWRYVSVEEIDAVLAACPSTWWRLLIVLSRYAGLRCPSEHFALRWCDVRWDQDYFVIESPKTGLRRCPLFGPVRKALEEAWEVASQGGALPGDAYIFPDDWRSRAQTSRGFRNCNLRTPFVKILRRAGIQPWPDLFHALRKSCETDLVRSFPLPQVAKWLGNSSLIAYRHYLDVTDATLRQAARVAWPMEQEKEASKRCAHGCAHYARNTSQSDDRSE